MTTRHNMTSVIAAVVLQLMSINVDAVGSDAAGSSRSSVAGSSSSSTSAGSGRPLEYCLSDTFNASCPRPDQLVLMTTAVYGRMRSGRCTKTAQLGCQADVLSIVDAVCSMRPTCSFAIARLLHVDLGPCDDEYKSYLEAGFACVRVARGQCLPPTERQKLLVDDSDYLSVPGPGASPLTAGTQRCPWRIVVDQRQGIRVRLFSFGTAGTSPVSTGGGASGGVHPQQCQVSAVFDGVTQTELCLSVRQRVIHEVKTNELTMYIKYSWLQDAHQMSTAWSYLIYYEATGCPSIKQSSDAAAGDSSGVWVQYQSDTATVRCNRTDETWYLRCDRDTRQWLGTVGNCSASNLAVANDAEARMYKATSLSFGLIMAVVIGVLLGVVIGAVPLGLAYVCLKSKWRQSPAGYLRGDDIYDPAGAFGKVTDDSDGRSSLYPALMATHLQQHHHHQGAPPPTHLTGRLPGSVQPLSGAYYGARCAGSVGYREVPLGQTGLPADVIADDGRHDCGTPGCQGGRRAEHVYESAAAGGGFGTGLRGAGWVRRTEESYLIPGSGVSVVQTVCPPDYAEGIDGKASNA